MEGSILYTAVRWSVCWSFWKWQEHVPKTSKSHQIHQTDLVSLRDGQAPRKERAKKCNYRLLRARETRVTNSKLSTSKFCNTPLSCDGKINSLRVSLESEKSDRRRRLATGKPLAIRWKTTNCILKSWLLTKKQPRVTLEVPPSALPTLNIGTLTILDHRTRQVGAKCNHKRATTTCFSIG